MRFLKFGFCIVATLFSYSVLFNYVHSPLSVSSTMVTLALLFLILALAVAVGSLFLRKQISKETKYIWTAFLLLAWPMASILIWFVHGKNDPDTQYL